MRYKVVSAILLSGVILASFSCSKSKDALVQKPLSENIRGISSLDNVVFHQTESSARLSFSSDVEWRVDNVPNWINIKGITGNQGGIGTTVIDISVPNNLTGSTRSANLLFIERGGDGKQLAQLTVSQPAVSFQLSLPASASDNNLAYDWFEHYGGTNGGPRTVSVKSNIFWEIEESYSGQSSAFYTFSQMDGENDHDVSVVPTNPNFEGDFEVLVTIVPYSKPEDGSPLKRIEGLDPLTFTMTQSHLHFVADWAEGTVVKTSTADASMPIRSIFGQRNVDQTALFSELGPKDKEGAPGEGAFDYTESAQTQANFTVSSVTPWIVTKCPEWLELSVGGVKLNVMDRDHLVPAGETTVSVKILGANPLLNQERLDQIEIAPHHVDAIDDNNNYIVSKDVYAAQAPFIFEVSREDGSGPLEFNFKNDMPDDVYNNQGYGDDETFSILVKVSGTNDNFELIDLPAWLKYATPVMVNSDSNWTQWRHVFSLKAQNLAFSLIDSNPAFRQKASLTQTGEVESDLSTNVRFTQDAFSFDVSLQSSQTIGGVLYEIDDLPPALTIAKQVTAGRDLFTFSAGKMSGEWVLGEGTSSWIKVYSQARPTDVSGQAITGGMKGSDFTFWFGPETANQNALNTQRVGKLQVVSARHLEQYGSLDQVPPSAKHEWTVTQRLFRYSLTASGTNQPAYSNNFDDRLVTLNVRCDGQWEIRQSEIPEFLTHKEGPLSADGADGNYTVKFGIKPNPTTSAKVDNIKVYCLDRNDELKTMAVNQEAFVFKLASGQSSSFSGIPAYVQTGTNYSVNMNVTEGAVISVSDNTTGQWAGKLSSSATKGAGKDAISTLYFHPLTNVSLTSARSGNVSVSIVEPVGVASPITLNFAQNKYLFSITESEDFAFSELSNRSKTMHITSSGPWSLTTDKSWLHVSTASGNGSESATTVTVSADENVNTSDRSGVVTFKTTVDLDQTATKNVSQSAYKWEVTTDDPGLDYTFEPLELTEKTIKVKSSGPWSLSNVPNWVKVSAPSYNGDESGAWTLVKLESTKNLSTAASARAKTGFNIVANKNTSLSGAVYVTQKPFIWEVTGEKDMAWTSPLSKVSKSVSVKSSGAWKIVMGNKSLPAPGKLGEHWTWSWSEQSGGSKADAVSVSPDVNNSFEDASASFGIVSIEHESQGGSLKETISCFQPKYVMEFNTSSIIFEPWNKLNEALNQTTSVPVTCTTGNWTLEESSDWINVSKSSGNAIVTVDNYNGSSSRNATVTLKSTDTDITLTRTLNVSQDPYVFKVHNSSDSEQTVHTKGVEAKQVPIDCSASFQIDDLPDFVQANITNGQLVFSVSKNTNATQRVGEIKLTSHGLTIPVKLTQMPYLFSIEGLTNQGTGVLPPSADGKLSFKVHSNVSWSMTMPSSWAKLVSGSTYGNPVNQASATTYNIVIGPTDSNNSSVAHTGSLSFANDIYGSSAAPFICNLRQDGFTTGTVTLPDFDAYSASTLSQTSQFASSVDWSANVTSGGNWLSVSPDAGVGGTSPTLTITASNNTGSARSGAIVISGTGDAGTYTRTINVNQKAFVWSVSATSHNFVAWNPADFEFSVTSPASSTISASENWVHLSTENIGAGTNVVTVSVDGNTGYARQATITVTTAGVNTKTISIKQEAFMFSASPVNVQVNAYSPAAVKISITSSGDVNVASDAAWLTAGAALVPAGVQKELWLTADSNYAGEQRVGHVTLTTVAANTIVTVTQSAFEWSVSPSSGGFAAYNPSVQYLTVTSSAPVTLSSTEDWIHFPSNLDAGKEVLATVTADNNTASTSRTAYITLSTAEHSKQVPFTQAAFQWSVTGGDSHNFVATNAPAFTFNVTSSAPSSITVLYVSGGPGWLQFPASVDAGSAKPVQVSAANNTSTSARNAKLTVSSAGHTHIFNITQAGLPEPPAE